MCNSVAYNEDCIEVMSRIEDNSVDLVVTSPPYDDLRTYNGFSFDWKTTIKELYRITKDGGVVVWVVSDQTIDGSETGSSFRQALWAMECGFNLHDTMIWEKPGFTAAGTLKFRYASVFEYMFVFSKGKPKTFNPIKDRRNKHSGEKKHGTIRQPNGNFRLPSSIGKEYDEFGQRYNVWRISHESVNKTGHPAVFPIQLAKDHIISWSNEGDLVFDPFLGSGTTRIASYDLNRNFIGCEISKEYFDKEEERFFCHKSGIEEIDNRQKKKNVNKLLW